MGTNGNKIKGKPVKKLSEEAKNRMFPSRKSNLDSMKLLTTAKAFQKIVQGTRVFLDIPVDGFGKYGAAVEAWTDQMDARADKELRDSSFRKMIREQSKQISEKIERGEIDESTAKKQRAFLHNNLPWNHLTDAIDFIIRKFKMPLNFTNEIRHYILTGDIKAPLNNFTISRMPMDAMSGDTRYLAVNVYAKLTNHELQQIKKQTELMLGDRLPSYSELRQIDKLIMLDKHNRDKNRFDTEQQKNYKMTAKEISKEILKTGKKRQQVYDSTRQLEELRKKRFGTE